VILPDGTRLTPAGRREHWRRVALIVTRMTGKRVGVDTATRTATGLSSLSRFTCARPRYAKAAGQTRFVCLGHL
jgi:hypothetical protein